MGLPIVILASNSKKGEREISCNCRNLLLYRTLLYVNYKLQNHNKIENFGKSIQCSSWFVDLDDNNRKK